MLAKEMYQCYFQLSVLKQRSRVGGEKDDRVAEKAGGGAERKGYKDFI